MDPIREHELIYTRRQLFGKAAFGIGTAALASLLQANPAFASAMAPGPQLGGLPGVPHFAPKAKRVIYLTMNGAPSQIDTWDYKPKLNEHFNEDLPEEIRRGQRLTTMTSGQERFPIAPSRYRFDPFENEQGQIMVSELLPHTAGIVKDICVIKSMYTEAINHDPAVTYIATGSQLPGRPALGAWVSYGLGSANSDLPTYVVLHSTFNPKANAQAVFSRLWGTGFLPSEHGGVVLRSSGDAMLYLRDPDGVNRTSRRSMLDALNKMNGMQQQDYNDPEISARIAQYEMAYKLQASVPELMDISGESEATMEMYGSEVRKPGTFAANCLLARRLAERGVRFIQIFHRGWDQHGNLAGDLPLQCKDVDQPSAALIKDLKQRGLLDDTLVIWGGEFGRTVYCQGPLSRENYGRDHHPRCFTIWMAGGGVKPGTVYGQTDDYSYNILDKDGNPMNPTPEQFNPGAVHIHDLNATLMHLMGIDHTKLTYRYQGRDFRLTDVHGFVVNDLMK